MTERDITFNAGRFAFIARFVSTDATLYYFNGVLIEPHPKKGVVMVATDGRVMALALDSEGHTDRPVIVATKPKARPVFNPRRGQIDDCQVELTRPGGRFDKNQYLAVRRGGPQNMRQETELVELIDASFPDWRRVVPWDLLARPSEHAAPLLNPYYLSALCAPYPGISNAIETRAGKDKSIPALFLRSEMPWFMGVMMPLDYTKLSAPIDVSAGLRALAPKPEKEKAA